MIPSSGAKKEMSNPELEAARKAILRGLTTLVKTDIVALEDYKKVVKDRDTFQQNYLALMTQSQNERQELGKALSAEKAKTNQSEAIAERFAEGTRSFPRYERTFARCLSKMR